MLPLGIPRRLRGKLVRKEPASNAVARLEDLVRDTHMLEKHGSTQACNAGTDDGNAVVPWWSYGPPVLESLAAASLVTLEQLFPGGAAIFGYGRKQFQRLISTVAMLGFLRCLVIFELRNGT